jgi:hypothetical protein
MQLLDVFLITKLETTGDAASFKFAGSGGTGNE